MCQEFVSVPDMASWSNMFVLGDGDGTVNRQ